MSRCVLRMFFPFKSVIKSNFIDTPHCHWFDDCFEYLGADPNKNVDFNGFFAC